jgi:hypothetical protein
MDYLSHKGILKQNLTNLNVPEIEGVVYNRCYCLRQSSKVGNYILKFFIAFVFAENSLKFPFRYFLVLILWNTLN